jgi:hypothetical protein
VSELVSEGDSKQHGEGRDEREEGRKASKKKEKKPLENSI